MSADDLALLAVVAIAPLAIVLIVALLRGYTMTMHLTRDLKRGRRRRGSNGDDDE